MLVVILAAALTAHAVPISGNISFAGGVTFNNTSAISATAVTSWASPAVSLVSGTFATSSPGAALADPAQFTTSSWNLNTFTHVLNFWSVDGFSFELLSSSVFQQTSSSIIATGTVIVSGNGYTPTSMLWMFTAPEIMVGYAPTATFRVYSNNNGPVSVPDGGATAALLGIALAGLRWMRKPLMAGSVKI